MQPNSLQSLVGNTDIYLLDQIMKGRYLAQDFILDAGCGMGRNLQWFLNNNVNIYGIDLSETSIAALKNQYPQLPADRIQVAAVENLPFPDQFFDHIVSSAVLHFAENNNQFMAMCTEMVRVLKPGGSFFIRMTSDIGIENKSTMVAESVFIIPDGSTRFLLTRGLIEELQKKFPLQLAEPVKTVNVGDLRCMTTLVFTKSFR